MPRSPVASITLVTWNLDGLNVSHIPQLLEDLSEFDSWDIACLQETGNWSAADLSARTHRIFANDVSKNDAIVVAHSLASAVVWFHFDSHGACLVLGSPGNYTLVSNFYFPQPGLGDELFEGAVANADALMAYATRRFPLDFTLQA